MTKQNIKGDFYMCLINSNIIEVENKEVKRNSDITYEERCKIEFMVKKKYTMQEMSEELGRNKSIISREIKSSTIFFNADGRKRNTSNFFTAISLPIFNNFSTTGKESMGNIRVLHKMDTISKIVKSFHFHFLLISYRSLSCL